MNRNLFSHGLVSVISTVALFAGPGLTGCGSPGPPEADAQVSDPTIRLSATAQSVDLLCPLLESSPDLPAAGLPSILADSDWNCGCSSGEEDLRCLYFGERDRRRSMRWPVSGSLRVELPAGKEWRRLRFAFRVVEGTFSSGSMLRMEVRSEGESIDWTRTDLVSGEWVDVQLDVSALAGRPVVVELESERLGGDEIVLIGAPRLISDVAGGEYRRANLLVYLVDTLRPDHMSLYGYSRETTPRATEFFEGGLVFSNAYATGPWTRPSTASVLTSLYPRSHGANADHSLADAPWTLAEHFRSAGFSTWAFVANGNVDGKGLGFEQGFDRFVGIWDNKHHALTETVNEIVFEHLDSFQDEPFFLYVHTVDPHAPYDPPEGYRGLYTDPDYDGPVHPELTRKKLLRAADLSPADREHVIGLYDEEIRYQDEMFGELDNQLERRGLATDLVTVLLSDHGEEFFEHGDWGHSRRLWEEQIRVPLAIQLPPDFRKPGGGAIETPVIAVDLMPTLLEWFGIEARTPLQGNTLSPLLKAPGSSPGIYTEELRKTRNLYSLRRDDLKVVLSEPADPASPHAPAQLFDLGVDRQEATNLAETRSGQFTSMREALEQFVRELEATHGNVETVVPELDEDTLRKLEALGYVGGP